MGEFKFSCPVCGQNVLCDATLSGTRLACPHCNNTIGVPTEFTELADVSAPPAIAPALPDSLPPTLQRTSALAVASLVCSLSSLVTCVGWLPGIICGHLANSRIRGNPSLKGNGLAKAGLTIGYLVLMLEAGSAAFYVWRFSTAVKQGFVNVQHDLATNDFIVTQTQSMIVSNDSQQVKSSEQAAVATNNEQIEAAASEWTSDISNASFPDHPAGGKLHGNDFIAKTVLFRNEGLRLVSANGMSVDIIRGLDADIEGKSYEFQSTDDSGDNPRIRMTWNESEVVQTATFAKGYSLKLEFGQAVNRTVAGKIYLSFPDDSKSYVTGTFELRLPKQK